MLTLLLVALLLVLLFGGLGYAVSPLFFIVLIVAVIALAVGGRGRYSSRW